MDEQELIGITLGNCTIERLIGRGGMGAVFLAQQSRPVRTVAIKVLLPPQHANLEQQRLFLARFRREADTVAKLEHKNILEIFEYEEAVINHQPLAYLVMPFIRGGTLRERMDEMQRGGDYFDYGHVVNYVDQIASALSYAHSFGIVHRDLKPANLLFHQDGRLLLSDFGIARLAALPSLTLAGSFMGTAEYASPEQASSIELDFRSDIYSLGVILYELLTNTVPFSGSNPFSVLSQHVHTPAPPIDVFRSGVPSEVESVVMKALAKKPIDRYQSAVDLAVDLRAAVVNSLAPAGQSLRLGSNAGENDLTISDHAWADNTGSPVQPSLQPAQAASHGQTSPWDAATERSIPAASVAGRYPFLPNGSGDGAAPIDLHDIVAGADNQFMAPPLLANGTAPNGTAGTVAAGLPMAHEGKRMFFYGTAAIALLAQMLVFLLMIGSSPIGPAAPVLAVLAGSSVNLLALAAIGFTAVVRKRGTARLLYRTLIDSVLALLAASALINFGGSVTGLRPLLAFIVLLLSNIFAIRQLALVDAKGEQVEASPIHWRGAIVGALTGLLPLTIILLFALSASAGHSIQNAPLMRLFGLLAIALIGAPTPGAMMAVWLSQKMSLASLVRSSAIAGLLLFVAAFLLVVPLGLLFSSAGLFLSQPGKSPLAVLLLAAFLGLAGCLRAMLDAWVFWKMTGKKRP
ncbi:MAG TPA: serine/threonine-protein kinase [Ktedonobacteraceae bacterium]|nr:serine/threonine-protein kinase [Ktedonobacteraceae bacterium]